MNQTLQVKQMCTQESFALIGGPVVRMMCDCAHVKSPIAMAPSGLAAVRPLLFLFCPLVGWSTVARCTSSFSSRFDAWLGCSLPKTKRVCHECQQDWVCRRVSITIRGMAGLAVSQKTKSVCHDCPQDWVCSLAAHHRNFGPLT